MTRKMLIGKFLCYYQLGDKILTERVLAPVFRGVKKQKEAVETVLKFSVSQELELIKYKMDEEPYKAALYLDDVSFYIEAEIK